MVQYPLLIHGRILQQYVVVDGNILKAPKVVLYNCKLQTLDPMVCCKSRRSALYETRHSSSLYILQSEVHASACDCQGLGLGMKGSRDVSRREFGVQFRDSGLEVFG